MTTDEIKFAHYALHTCSTKPNVVGSWFQIMDKNLPLLL